MPSLTERAISSGAVEEAAAIVARLAAAPRGAGTSSEHAARGWCAEQLQASGFRTTEQSFAYSALPGRWGTPLIGLAWLGVVAAAGHFGNLGRADLTLSILLGGLALVGVGGGWLVRRGVLDAPAMRRVGVNLIATRGTQPPRVWLMAHVDSKSQPVPIALRALAITATSVLLLVAVAMAVGQLLGMEWGGGWLVWTIVTAATTLPIVATTVADHSPGALDNASGVAVVLLAAAQAPPAMPVGICLTSAEELGLAGARAWVASGGSGGMPVLNVDGVDDVGSIRAMWSGTRPEALLAALARAGVRVSEPVAARRLLPGILTDAVAVSDAGIPAVTLSRGTARTLLRIHRPSDTPARISGVGIARVASVLATALKHY